MIIESILLAAVGFVALLTGLQGNTRPIGGGLVAIVLFMIIGRWGLGSLHDAGLAAIILLPALAVVSCGVSALGFILYMVITAVKGTYTIKLGAVGRIASICVAVISFVGIFYADQMTAWWKNYQEEAKNRQEEMAVRDSFPPAYRELCAPAEKGSIYNKSPEQAWVLYQNLRALLREKPLDTKDKRNDAVFTLLRRTVRGIAKDKDLQQLQEKRLELLRDAETFWQTGDAHNKNKFMAASIIDGAFGRPKPADGSIRERVLALKKDIIQAQLTKPEPDDHLELLFSILSWEADDAARNRSFDEFFDRTLKYSWEDAEYAAQEISLFGGQEAQENAIQAITRLISGPVPSKARGIYYGLYAKTHNDRWLVLADPTILFKKSPKLLEQKLFFLSEISMLRGEFGNSLKERAEYILLKGFGSFNNESTLLHGYYDPGVGSCKGTVVYVTDVNARREKYIPCGYSYKYKGGLCDMSDIYPEKTVIYHFSSCGDRDNVVLNGEKQNTSYSEDDYYGYSPGAIGNIFADFERMARSACFPEKPSLPVTQEQRACVFDVIKKMDIRIEPAPAP